MNGRPLRLKKRFAEHSQSLSQCHVEILSDIVFSESFCPCVKDVTDFADKKKCCISCHLTSFSLFVAFHPIRWSN